MAPGEEQVSADLMKSMAQLVQKLSQRDSAGEYSSAVFCFRMVFVWSDVRTAGVLAVHHIETAGCCAAVYCCTASAPRR